MANTSHPKRSLAAEFHDTWWSMALRGLAAVAFGIFVWATENPSLGTLTWGFALYALVDGVLALMAGAYGAKEHQPWMLLMVWGAIGVTAGVVAFVSPVASTTALLVYIAAFALAKGIVELIAAGKLRTDVAGGSMLAAAGVVSLALGALLIIRALVGEFSTLWAMVVYGLAWGALAIGLGFEARTYVKVEKYHEEGRHATVTPRHPR